jgi:inorganic pyrophosphatase
VIDGPLGSTHPEYGFVYLTNYGYVPGTVSGDGQPIDACVIGVDEPVDEICAAVIAAAVRRAVAANTPNETLSRR